jgi:hypothetical protein
MAGHSGDWRVDFENGEARRGTRNHQSKNQDPGFVGIRRLCGKLKRLEFSCPQHPPLQVHIVNRTLILFSPVIQIQTTPPFERPRRLRTMSSGVNQIREEQI